LVWVLVLVLSVVFLFLFLRKKEVQRIEKKWGHLKKRRKRNKWFDEAKLGIFVHWGPACAAAWAPTKYGTINEMIAKYGLSFFMKNCPYAGWYLNSMRIEGSDVSKHHQQKYGNEDHDYDRFVHTFEEESQSWHAAEWAKLFSQIGAQYVVLTSKHSDGYCLWPSKETNKNRADYKSTRDFVGELTEQVKKAGMKMGIYYCSGWDWTYCPETIEKGTDCSTKIPNDQEYIDYVDAHWRELIVNYKPSLLWNDIGYPFGGDLVDLFEFYYAQVPEGVVNDRFVQTNPNLINKLLRIPIIGRLFSRLADYLVAKALKGELSSAEYFDYQTTEYANYSQVQKHKWEATRGIGRSFFFNSNELPEDYISGKELIYMFCDIVSKNGNLLLNVGPQPDGTIPKPQEKVLLELGSWLSENGEAIYGSAPWVKAEGIVREANSKTIGVRFTQKDNRLFAILLGDPVSEVIDLEGIGWLQRNTELSLMDGTKLKWQQHHNFVKIQLPRLLPVTPALCITIYPCPQ